MLSLILLFYSFSTHTQFCYINDQVLKNTHRDGQRFFGKFHYQTLQDIAITTLKANSTNLCEFCATLRHQTQFLVYCLRQCKAVPCKVNCFTMNAALWWDTNKNHWLKNAFLLQNTTDKTNYCNTGCCILIYCMY